MEMALNVWAAMEFLPVSTKSMMLVEFVMEMEALATVYATMTLVLLVPLQTSVYGVELKANVLQKQIPSL
jgi:hypothetical protein